MVPIWYMLEVIGPLSVAIFSSFRVWAICGRKWLPFSVVLGFSLFAPAATLYTYAIPRTMELIPASDPDGGCAPMANTIPYEHLPVITRSIAIATDALILIITWAKTADIWKGSGTHRGNFRVVNLLLRDGTLYFCSLLVLNIVTLALDVLHSETQFSNVNSAISNVLVARFMLDLRGISYASSDDENTGRTSSVRFVGNLGAPPDMDRSTWASFAGDDLPRNYIKPFEQSRNPMADGLFEDTPEGTVSSVGDMGFA